ncbi:MAG: hypothetical protein OJF52_003561 [Nitrospira sp.]|nr:MAG: hypothetical protein OJF52_003561 [Nitrospira sp.]
MGPRLTADSVVLYDGAARAASGAIAHRITPGIGHRRQ